MLFSTAFPTSLTLVLLNMFINNKHSNIQLCSGHQHDYSLCRADRYVFKPNGYNGFVVVDESEAEASRRRADLDRRDHSTDVAERKIESKQVGFLIC